MTPHSHRASESAAEHQSPGDLTRADRGSLQTGTRKVPSCNFDRERRLRTYGRRPTCIAPCEIHPDRKSTRLNSSHRCIQYAVFCLKKKKDHTMERAGLKLKRTRDLLRLRFPICFRNKNVQIKVTQSTIPIPKRRLLLVFF